MIQVGVSAEWHGPERMLSSLVKKDTDQSLSDF